MFVKCNYTHPKEVINTEGSEPCITSGMIDTRACPHVLNPSVIRWIYAFMETVKQAYRKVFWKRLRWQIQTYYDEKHEMYSSSAESDLEYLMDLFEITEAKSISDITLKEIKNCIDAVGEKYKSRYFKLQAGKAIRCFYRHWRFKGLPVYSPAELKEIC